RLLGLRDADDINADRLSAARECSRRYNAVAVLKGAGSIVARMGQPAVIADCAEPTLAVAGSGGVLGGVTKERLSERTGVSVFDATVQAVLEHGRAGEHVHKASKSTRGALASEIANAVATALERP